MGKKEQASTLHWSGAALLLIGILAVSGCQGNLEQVPESSMTVEKIVDSAPPSPPIRPSVSESSSGPAMVPPSATQAANLSTESMARGASLYRQYCSRCHGVMGKGDGELAADLNPRPTNLAAGVYKFRSTPSGALPTDKDLFRTLSIGVPGTAMSDFRDVSEKDRWLLVGFLKTLSPRFIEEGPPLSIQFPETGVGTDQALERGQQIFFAMQCAACHGEEGRGDGPLADALYNSAGETIRPANLTKHPLKSGKDPIDIYRSVMTGLDGTPMPSFGDSLSPEEGWNLARYVFSLGQGKGEK